jgi:uncharacterized glyoxalase superfamily protein PhnB
MASRKKTSKRAASGKGRGGTGRAKRVASGGKRARPSASRGLALSGVAPSLTVDDIQKSLAWYRDVLGFAVKDRWEQDGTLMGVEIAAGPTVVFMLGQDDWKKGRDRQKGQGFRLYCETSQDIDSLAARIKGSGGTLAQEPRDEPWGSRALTVDDPDGFKITISKPLRKK